MAGGDALMVSVSGLRGTFGSTLSPSVVTRFAGAVAGFLQDQRKGKASARTPIRIVVGYDGRLGSASVADLARGALEMHGCQVIMLGQAEMTPTVGFAVDRLGADAGMQVTASHNPQQWCGLKVILRDSKAKIDQVSACAPAKALASKIIERFHSDDGKLTGAPIEQLTRSEMSDLFAGVGGVGGESTPGHKASKAGKKAKGVKKNKQGNSGPEALEVGGLAHVDRVLSLLTDLHAAKPIAKRKFKVVLDSVTPSGGFAASTFLDRLSAKVSMVTSLEELLTGIFPHTPEPTKENLVGLCKAVKNAKADVGFAQDPDGDRLAIVDETGAYIGEEYTLVLAAMALGELGGLKKKSQLVVNLSTSRMIEDVAKMYGCTVRRSAVGEANVVELLKELKSPFGGEGNGGVIWPAVTYIRDSIGAMGLVLALMAWRGQGLSQIIRTVPSYCIVKRKVDLAMPGKKPIDPKGALERAKVHYRSHHKDVAQDHVDGLWLNFESLRSWLHIRASNTEPIMRLIAEAPTKALADQLLDEAARAVGIEK